LKAKSYLLSTFITIFLASTSSAFAERADRSKPVNIEADRLNADDGKQVAVFEGRVVLTQGTFVLRSDKLVIQKDVDGFQHATAYGNPATFREKRDGSDEWIDGEALRVEYDGKREFIELFDTARLTRGKDEVRGSYISYDTRADYYTVQSHKGAPTAANKDNKDNRVRATLQPKAKEDPAAPATELRPARRIEGAPR
jgi:lipopolysaccharide export system protein LptA